MTESRSNNPCSGGGGFMFTGLFSLWRPQQPQHQQAIMTPTGDAVEEPSSSSLAEGAAAATAVAASAVPEQALGEQQSKQQEEEEEPTKTETSRRCLVRTVSSDSHDHALSVAHRDNQTSEVESLALKMENRRAQRMPVTWEVRHRFLRDCRKIAPIRISLQALLEYREAVQAEVDDMAAAAAKSNSNIIIITSRTLEWMGFRNTSKVLLQVLDMAVMRVQEDLRNHEWFYYHDFSFYFTKTESKWPFMRNPFYVSLWMFAAFYIGTAVLFCTIMEDPGVCPRDPDKPYSGWLTAVYFASSTMSTVGYGDVSVMLNNKGGGGEPPAKWRIFIGAMYMIASLLVVIFAFSAIISQATNKAPLLVNTNNISFFSKVSNYIYGPPDIKPGELLVDKIRRVRIAKLGAICLQFFVLNLLGMFVNRFFVRNAVEEDERWSWMETFYWSIQTTTTIGYGDMAMPFEMRWFQVFYLLISTYFVGDALGKLGSYSEEITQLRRFFAWNRREVSQGMIEDWQASVHDDKIDQYEFALASLLDLGTISHADLQPIMAKFRGLAGPKGYICMEDDFDEDGTLREPSAHNHNHTIGGVESGRDNSTSDVNRNA